MSRVEEYSGIMSEQVGSICLAAGGSSFIENGLEFADRIGFYERSDRVAVLRFFLIDFNRLASTARQELALRLLTDGSTLPASRLAMVACLIPK